MFKDRHGTKLFNGAYVHYKRDPFNLEPAQRGAPEELDGWVFSYGKVVVLYALDNEKNVYATGIYWELDGYPMWELEKK